MKNVLIAPSILSADFADMGKAVESLAPNGADMIHCDVMDGIFVPNISFGSKMVKDIKKHTNLPLDVHLMITKPERFVDDFIATGADYLTIHVEASDCIKDTLVHIRASGIKSGIVLNPATDLTLAVPYFDYVDMILLMSVNPGFGGQKFIQPVMQKIKDLRKMIDNSGKDILLEVDGGVCEENYREIIASGADVLVAGSFLFSQKNMQEKIATMKTTI